MTPEALYLRLYDEIKAREALETRLDVLEFFIKKQFPEFFAGDAETIADPELNPVVLDFSAPLVGELPQHETEPQFMDGLA